MTTLPRGWRVAVLERARCGIGPADGPGGQAGVTCGDGRHPLGRHPQLERARPGGARAVRRDGYDTTTVADIAARAGLTKSTFFRHFDDKREVLFFGQDDMIDVLTESVASTPPGEPPLSCVAALLSALGGYSPPGHRALAVLRSTVIGTFPELRERELLERAQLVTAIEDALRSHGVDDLTARLDAMRVRALSSPGVPEESGSIPDV